MTKCGERNLESFNVVKNHKIIKSGKILLSLWNTFTVGWYSLLNSIKNIKMDMKNMINVDV